MKPILFPIYRISRWFVLLALLGMPALDRIHAADAKAPSEKAPASAPLTPAKEIIAKFIEATGGREANLKITSHHSTGKFEMPAQGLSGPLEVFAVQPNKLLVKIKIEGMGEIIQGFDGKVGWSIDPAQGPMVLKDKILDQLRDQANFYSSLHDEKDYTSMETVEKTTFEGKECYKVKLVKKTGQETAEYFDVKTGLMVGVVATYATALGAIPVTSTVDDYKEFGAVKIPTKVSQKMAGVQQLMTITNIEFNKVQDSVFALPEQIKALAK